MNLAGSPRSQRIHTTWLPSYTRQYRRPGGPWDVPHLDTLMTNGRSEVVDGPFRLNHQEIESMVQALAYALGSKGVKRSEVVAWQLPNSLASLLLYRACWRIGAVAAPVLHSFGPSEVDAALAQVNPRLFIDLDPLKASDPAKILEELVGPGVYENSQLTKASVLLEAQQIRSAKPRVSDIAVVLFTSGSTGTPKAVLHTHRSLAWKALLMADVHGLSSTDCVLMPAPLAHVSGLLNGILLPGSAGMRAVLMRRFDPSEALEIIEREHVSFMAGPPTFFISMSKILEESTDSPSVESMRLISSGGASVTPAFIEATAQAFDCRVKRTYGSTEAPTVTTSTNDDPAQIARDTEGRAVGEVKLRIVDPVTFKKLPDGEPGELWVRGPELFAGYVDSEQTKQAIAPGGWFRTGDLGIISDGGWLRIVGRIKDVIIRGGENISASEVEAVLESHPNISQAVAVGYPDPLMGERVMAFVVSSEPFELDQCIQWFLTKGVAKFKTPEKVKRLREIPLLGSGKPDRNALKELASAHDAH